MALKAFIKRIAGKLAGIDGLQEQIDGLHYVLNACIDIRTFPKATGALRDLQKGDVLLLQIFDRACRKHGLTYWLDAGTLLGAVRHGGFIPWDDDLDVCMPRDDFNRAKTVLCEELRSYGLQAEEDIPLCRIGIGYKHKQTGVWLDVFPIDYCAWDMRVPENRCNIFEHITEFRKFYDKKKDGDKSKLEQQKKRIFAELADEEHAISLFYGPEASGRLYGWNIDEVYPLQEMQFEGEMFSAPANVHMYLTEMYGANYMQFPKTGILHHGDERGGLESWASQSGTDMNEIHKELEQIFSNMKDEVKE